MKSLPWYALKSPEKCHSPALLVYPERIEKNIDLMIGMAGGVSHIRPHVKTHKMAEITLLQMARGINKFKCATIAEAEMLGVCKAPDVLLALQPVGPNIRRLSDLVCAFPETVFSTILDDIVIAHQLNDEASKRKQLFNVYMDVNVGMDRTGIRPDKEGCTLYKNIHKLPHLHLQGLHVYDGHIRDTDIKRRKEVCDAAFQPVSEFAKKLEEDGLPVTTIIAGGSPTFPIHSKREGVETSPGTTLLWDDRYASIFPDMPFMPAAVLLTRIISKPGNGLICLDMGHKGVAAEMPFPRLRLLDTEICEQISQSEEHLVIEHPGADTLAVGDLFYALPAHVCPTVAKYSHVFTVVEGEIREQWQVVARDRQITI